jgi:hypothetical protein
VLSGEFHYVLCDTVCTSGVLSPIIAVLLMTCKDAAESSELTILKLAGSLTLTPHPARLDATRF